MALIQALEAHSFANIFPMISEEAYPEFKADIEKNGLTDPIVLFEGKILDGRNRLRVLRDLYPNEVNAPEYFVNFEDLGLSISAFDYVISKNLQRRHLDESQRSMVAARMANMRQGQRTDLPKLPIDTEPSANLHNVSQGDAANLFNVSPRSVSSAKKIIDHGIPELQAMVDAGKVAVSVAEKVASLPRSEQGDLLKSAQPETLKTKMRQRERDKREAGLAGKQLPLPQEEFGVIYADPEWQYLTRSAAGMDRSAENHYPTSHYLSIAARRVRDIAAKDCVLFMWVTVPMLIEAICVLDAWGFVVLNRNKQTGWLEIDKTNARYVSQWSWLKTRIANGYWGRNKHEILLIATKGNPVAPAPGQQPDSVITEDGIELAIPPALDDVATIEEAAREHSRKPDIFAEWISKLYPNTKKIELNARRPREGWTVWGNEIDTAQQEIAEEALRRSHDLERWDPQTYRERYEDEFMERNLYPKSKESHLAAGLVELCKPYHEAVITGSIEKVFGTFERLRAFQLMVNDWEHKGSAVGRWEVITELARKAAGGFMHYLGGVFKARHDGISAYVETDYYGYEGASASVSIHAIDIDRPFPSETGYHLRGDVPIVGRSIEEIGRVAIAGAIEYATNKKLNQYAKGLLLPRHVYTLENGSLVSHDRAEIEASEIEATEAAPAEGEEAQAETPSAYTGPLSVTLDGSPILKEDGTPLTAGEIPEDSLLTATIKGGGSGGALDPGDVESVETISYGKTVQPPLAKYRGEHTEETDALIRYGYENGTSLAVICAWLDIPAKRKGVVKGRAHRLGLTGGHGKKGE